MTTNPSGRYTQLAAEQEYLRQKVEVEKQQQNTLAQQYAGQQLGDPSPGTMISTDGDPSTMTLSDATISNWMTDAISLPSPLSPFSYPDYGEKYKFCRINGKAEIKKKDFDEGRFFEPLDEIRIKIARWLENK